MFIPYLFSKLADVANDVLRLPVFKNLVRHQKAWLGEGEGSSRAEHTLATSGEEKKMGIYNGYD